MNIATNVTGLHRRMTDADYDRERAKIPATKRDAMNEAGVRWEQQLATLFYRSGWTQEQLAAKEGRPQSRISEMLLFGRFLNFIQDRISTETLPNNLSQSRFQNYYVRAGKNGGNERIRFQEVMRLMQADLKLGNSRRALPKGVGRKIREQFADGKWHSHEEIIEGIGGDAEGIKRVLQHIATHDISYGMHSERKQVGSSFHERFFKQEKAVSIDELAEKLKPIIKELMIQGRANMATISPAGVLYNAGKLKKLLQEWIGRAAEDDDE
jgi:hypothetical protein